MGVADLILLVAWLFVGNFQFLCSVRDGLSPIKGVPLRDKKRFNVSELIVRSSATWGVEQDGAFGTGQGVNFVPHFGHCGTHETSGTMTTENFSAGVKDDGV
jgi:hypothetical protein